MRALLLVIERRFDDDDDDAAASEMGELFSTAKAKSLSLFLSSTKHPTARMREELLYSATRMKTSLFFFFFERARLREHKFYYTLFCKNTLFFSLSVCLEK